MRTSLPVKLIRLIALVALSLAVWLAVWPGSVWAQGLVPCGTATTPACTVKDLFVLAGNIIKFLLFTLAVPLATIAITWAGITMVVHAGEPAKIEEAKKMLWYAAIGLAVALAAYLIVNTIVSTLTKGGAVGL